MSCWFLAGMCYGDEGKGSITDALVRHTGADLIVRYNGGSQAAHNVSLPDGRHHTFSQFGSGTFIPNVITYLSRFMLVDPSTMLIEDEDIRKVGVNDALHRTYVDGKAVVITRYQRALNRLVELSRSKNRHGSTGMGIGVARADHIRYGDDMLLVEDLPNPKRTAEKLSFIRHICQERADGLKQSLGDTAIEVLKEYWYFKDSGVATRYIKRYEEWCKQVHIVNQWVPHFRADVIFEGAQGMLLDEKHGFQPHTTFTNITFNNAETILNEMGYSSPIYKIGVLRSYYTRHGAGPFPSENPDLLSHVTEEHNKCQIYTGDFRVGDFDIPLALKALHDIQGVDFLAINHMDIAAKLGTIGVRLSKKTTVHVPYQHFLDLVEEVLRVPVKIIGYGPTHKDKDFKEIPWENSSCLVPQVLQEKAPLLDK